MTLSPRRLLRLLSVLPVVAALTMAVSPTGALASSTSPVSQRQVTVMTRNLYLGADLTRLLSAANPIAGAAQIAGIVEASQPAQRMAWVADEIAAAHPDLVGLQEVADWHIPGLNPADGTRLVPAASYDFLALLQQDLVADGAPYRVVVSHDNFDSSQQLPAALAALATFKDRDVILARADDPVSQLQVLDTAVGRYATQFSIGIPSLGGLTIDFRRGYEWADLKTRGKVWRLVNTHPEAYAPSELGQSGDDVNGPEAGELVDAMADSDVPVVVVGDLNSYLGDPLRHAYAVLHTAGFADTWLQLGLSDAASTCCRNETLGGGVLDERIDHVLASGDITPVSAVHVGVSSPVDTTSTPPPPLPWWASDHAGVVTTVSVGKQ